jgi:flagellin-specific chaperone FliS
MKLSSLIKEGPQEVAEQYGIKFFDVMVMQLTKAEESLQSGDVELSLQIIQKVKEILTEVSQTFKS